MESDGSGHEVLKPTLSDIARLAGISTSTASRALAGKKGIAAETVERVMRAATQLHYPIKSAGCEHTNTIGVLVANLASSFFATVVEAIEEVALQRGYQIILCNSAFQPKRQAESLRLMMQRQVDGLIVVPIETEDPDILKFHEEGVPLVQVDRYVDNVPYDAVTSDNRRSAYRATQFLIEQGYHRIGLLSGPQNQSAHRDRLQGALQAMADARTEPDPRLVKIGSGNRSSGYQLASELLDSQNRPDGIFTGSIEITTGALLAIRDRGVSIPEDIGIVAFDDFEFAGLLDPPLTAVRQPAYELGAAAADLLIRRIEERTAEYEPVRMQLETSLIVRSSTCPQPVSAIQHPAARQPADR